MTLLPMTTAAALLDDVDQTIAERKQRLLFELLGSFESCLVAFSGGVDSTYLAWAASQALGRRASAITAVSPSYPAHMREECRRLATHIGIDHRLIATAEVDDPRYRKNDGDRCYWCKSELYQRLAALAAERPGSTVVDGTNRDDLGDHRPGRRAASEHTVRSPLVEVGLTKAELRWLSRAAGLATWGRPASPCLSSRIPYGMAVDESKLRAIDRAEEALRELGLREFRVRHLGREARVEVAADEHAAATAASTAGAIDARLQQLGFQSVTIDPEPFRSGRLSEAISTDGR